MKRSVVVHIQKSYTDKVHGAGKTFSSHIGVCMSVTSEESDIWIKETVSDHREREMLHRVRLQRLSSCLEAAECLTGHWKNVI